MFQTVSITLLTRYITIPPLIRALLLRSVTQPYVM